MKYPLVDIHDVENTKDRILLSAVKLFAERGYAAVSVRDIANSVGINPASLYNHFKSKEILFDTIIDPIEGVYLEYYDRVAKLIEKASGFAQVVDSLFTELREVYHMFIFYGVSLIATEQFRNERARVAFHEVYMKVGIDYSKNLFDECIQKGWVKPFDTQALATLFMNSVFAGSLIRTMEDMEFKTVYHATEMFVALQDHILKSVEVIQ